MSGAVKRINEVAARMQMHRIETNEPFIINDSEVDEVTAHLMGAKYYDKASKAQVEFTKNALRTGKCKLLGHKIHVIK